MDMKGTKYLPASITFPESRKSWRYAMHWYKKDYNEYSEKYHCYYYPFLLVSPFVTGINRTREKDFPQAEYIVSDSGGYQKASHKAGDFSVLDILRWQENIADVAFTVDVPAYSYISETAGYRYYPDDFFMKCMEESNNNAVLMMDSKENKDMELWGVVQGGNYNDLKKWYDDLNQRQKFPGYAIPTGSTVMPRKKDDWISQLKFAKEVGTNFHFLGRCEPLLVLVLSKMSLQTKKYYTYDTASAAAGLMYGTYYDPMFLNSYSFSKMKIDERPNFDLDGHVPCDCPVCQKHTYKEMMEGYYTLLLHNVYVKNRYNDYFNVIAQDDNVFQIILEKLIDSQPLLRRQKESNITRINNLLFGDHLTKQTLESFY